MMFLHWSGYGRALLSTANHYIQASARADDGDFLFFGCGLLSYYDMLLVLAMHTNSSEDTESDYINHNVYPIK